MARLLLGAGPPAISYRDHPLIVLNHNPAIVLNHNPAIVHDYHLLIVHNHRSANLRPVVHPLSGVGGKIDAAHRTGSAWAEEGLPRRTV